MNKFNSHTDASIGFFLGTNPKLNLCKVSKEKINEIYTQLDLYDDDTKPLTKETTSNHASTQEIVILTYDIYNKVFGLGIGVDNITTTFFEIRTSLQHTLILKSILYKISHTNNNPTVQYIPYDIQEITNKDAYKTVVKKKNVYI